MKKFLKGITLVILSFVLLYLFYFLNSNHESNLEIISPLPKLLSQSFPKVFNNNEHWKPKIKNVYVTNIKKPYFVASSVLSYDLTTDRLLYSQNIKEKLPLASLTKIMTAIVALENDKLDKEIRISKKAAGIGENVMGLSFGEKLKLEDLLYGLILLSGNDAAEAIAETSQFGRDNFVYIMNKKAEDLGLTDTHFTNPSGLEGDGKQYSTAYDLLVMTRYGLQNSDFAKIVSTVTHEIPVNEDHKSFSLFNETNLLTSYPGVKGVKTGYTYEAGLCLVTYLDYGGHKIIALLLNAGNRRQEMKDLLDYSLKTLGVNPPPHS